MDILEDSTGSSRTPHSIVDPGLDHWVGDEFYKILYETNVKRGWIWESINLEGSRRYNLPREELFPSYKRVSLIESRSEDSFVTRFTLS